MKTDTPKGPRRSQFNSSDDKYLKRAKLLRQESSAFLRMMAVITIFIIGLALSFLVLGDNTAFLEEHLGKDNVLTKFSTNVSKDNDTKQKAEFSLPFGNKRKNILLLGVDSNGQDSDPWDGTRTDTIILMNIDPKTKSLNAISIPIDSKVYLPEDHGIQKINAAHAIGGVGMTIRTVEETLGVKIDRYIMVHDSAVKEIVDAIGGIDIYVEKDMHYNDFSGKLFINLKKGKNRLNGKQVVGYLRFRHDAMGDIGRTQRQQWFLRGLMEEVKKPETLAKLPEIIAVANKYIKTNMTFYELTQYAGLAKHLDMDKVEVAMLPGAPNKKGYISYWILDPEKTQEVVNRLIYREKVNPQDIANVKASIMYSAGYEEEVQLVKEQLATLGVEVICTGLVNKTHTQFIAHSKNISNEYFNWLKKKTPSIIGYQFVYEPTDYYCNGTDFTIIIAGK
ncbi:LCP family protein [bacterium]|nr:LCP family protein [bacterium]